MLPTRIERAVADTYARKIALVSEFDRSVQAFVSEAKTAIMCRAGCAHCCYYPNYISVLEAVPIYRHLTQRGEWAPSFKKDLKKHGDTTLALAPEIWLLSLTPCPLLRKDRCMAYPVRPLTCRATYSMGDPLRCHPHRASTSPNMVSKTGILHKFSKDEARAFKVNGAHLVPLPISVALLLAEGLCNGDPEFEAMDGWVYRELEAKR
jgi:Fe-S-cluster containining protein